MVVKQIATTPSDEVFLLTENGTVWRYGYPNPSYFIDENGSAVALPRELTPVTLEW
jgi:hypothetical protein